MLSLTMLIGLLPLLFMMPNGGSKLKRLGDFGFHTFLVMELKDDVHFK